MTKITIIGAGPGGYVAALKAAILGADVTLIEKDKLGGTCLNRGCIPTKALLAGADVLGINDFSEISKRKDSIVKQLVGGVGFLTQNRRVKVIQGTARLTSATRVSVAMEDGSSQTVEADKIILATGSIPAVPGFIPYDGDLIMTSDEALALETLPDSMTIIGGGVIGCEFGQFYARNGVKVNMVEMMPHILPEEDDETAKVLAKALKKDGVQIYAGTKSERIEAENGKVHVTLSDGTILESDKLLVSIGRVAFTEGLGLDAVGIKTEKGKIVVNDKMETSVPGIYAIGDIVDTPLLAHVASREGMAAVENALGGSRSVSYRAIPRCIYTSPEVAAVGMTEKKAREAGIQVEIGQFAFSGLGKAMVINETTGFVKIMTDENDVIIGASIVGPHATDMISELTLAVHVGMTAETLGDVIHPHPTLSEAIMEAAHDVHKQSVHSF